MCNSVVLSLLVWGALLTLCSATPIKQTPSHRLVGGAMAALSACRPGMTTYAASAAQAAPTPQGRRKCALLIGISQYAGGRWEDLHTGNNLDIWQEVLTDPRFDFDTVVRVQDAINTRRQFWDCLDKFKRNHLRRGDIVFLHYSGHGSSIRDVSGDEVDSLDEVLVLGGAGSPLQAEHIVIDDELGRYLRELRLFLGPNGSLFITVDACYSGSVTRGVDADELFNAGVAGISQAPEMFDSFAGDMRPTGYRGSSADADSESGLAPYAIFTAASHTQMSREVSAEFNKKDGYKSYGPLSLAMCSILRSTQRHLSCSEMRAKIAARFAYLRPDQTPQLEGYQRLGMFNAAFIPADLCFNVVRSVAGAPRQVVVDGGRMHGLSDGAVLEIHDQAGRKLSRSRLICRGRVVSASPDSSIVMLDTFPGMRVLNNCKVFVDVFVFHSGKLHVSLRNLPPSLSRQLDSAFNHIRLVATDAEQSDLYVTSDSVNIYVGDLSTKTIYETIPLGNDDWLGRVRRRLLKVLRNRYLLSLESAAQDSAVNVEVELIPAGTQAGEQRPANSAIYPDAPAPQNLRLRRNQHYSFKAVNLGTKDAWVHILQIVENGEIIPLVPAQRSSFDVLPGQDNVLEPGQEYTFSYRSNGELTEVVHQMPPRKCVVKFLILATAQPCDFTLLFGLKGGLEQDHNRPLHPLLQVLNFLMDGEKGGEYSLDESAFGFVRTLTVEVV